MKVAFKTCVACLAAGVVIAFGATKSSQNEARVTQIIRDVQLLPAGSTPRPAVQDDQVSENTGVRTGDESRTELTFEDLTITRLGANTIFSFNKAGRSGELESGAILLRVPKNSGGAEFRTKAVTVGITGTTVIFESTQLGNASLTVMEGGARLRLNKNPKEFKKVRAGQILRVEAGAVRLPEPEDVDLDQVMRTNPLFTDFPPLPSDNLIRTAIRKQQTGGSVIPPVSQGVPIITRTPRPVVTGIPTPIATPPPPFQTPTPGIFPTRTPGPKPTPRKRNTPRPIATPRPIGTPRATPSPKGSATPTILLKRTPKKGLKRPTPTATPRVIP
jgi:hypothetical protein